MKRRLIAALIAVAALVSSSALAGVNPHILEVHLGPGGFVAKGGWKKITLGYSGPAPLRLRLNWNSANIAVYTDTNATVAIPNEKEWDVEHGEIMPTNLWVKGLAVSASGPTSTTLGPEHMCLEAINNGTPYVTRLFDRVGFTVYRVDKIIVTPKGVSSSTTLPDPVRIGVGAIASPAHQADVEMQVVPLAAGIPIDINLIGGRGNASGKDAKLDIGAVSALGDGAPVTVPTDANGKIAGVLTSCDVDNSSCTIHTCTKDANAIFTWVWLDGFDYSVDWLLNPEFLPVSGIVTNRFKLRHHRMEDASAPWAPFDQHEVRFFIEEVQWQDNNGGSGVIINTPERPSDEVNAWAHFNGPVTTDAGGLATAELVVLGNPWLQSLKIVAYDWIVYKEPAPAPVGQQMAPAGGWQNIGPTALTTENTTTASPGDERAVRTKLGNQVGPLRPLIALAPSYVPVVATNATVAGTLFGGDLYIYIANWDAHPWSAEFKIRNPSNGVWEAAGNDMIIAVANPAAEVPIVDPSFFAASDGSAVYNRYHTMKIAAFRKGNYRVIITGPNSGCCFTNEFTAIEGRLDFTGDTQPIRVNTNLMDYAIFPLYNPAVSTLPPAHLTVQGCLKGVPESATYTLVGMDDLSAGSAFQFQPSSGPTCAISATTENDAPLSGSFWLKSNYTKTKVYILSPAAGTAARMSATSSTLPRTCCGSLAPLRLVAPNVSIVHPSGQRPPDGEDGARVQNNDALFVFDSAASPGKCPITNETTKLPALSSIAKTLVWQNLEWVQPDIANVTRVGPTAVTDEPWKTAFSYEQMPLHNDAFGNADLTLRFRDRIQWAWKQPIQFRFNRTGTSAAARVAPTMPNYVAAGNPNWYVYWQQVANQFSGTAGGSFGPQATNMYYDSANVGPNNTAGYHVPTGWFPYKDKIVIYDCNKSLIFDYVKTIHHENGHHQSRELPANQGGWGPNITYMTAQDSDRDTINDAWEAQGGTGAALGFTIDLTPVIQANNLTWRGNWDHGWTSATPGPYCITNAPFSFSPYCNPNGYNQATGSGLCPRNEAEVVPKRTQIEAKDWSYKP